MGVLVGGPEVDVVLDERLQVLDGLGDLLLLDRLTVLFPLHSVDHVSTVDGKVEVVRFQQLLFQKDL